MTPDVFSFFRPAKKAAGEPPASTVAHASPAETQPRLELEVFDPRRTFFEPTLIESGPREERVVALEARFETVAKADQPLAPRQMNVARPEEGPFGGMTPRVDGALASFADQTDRVPAGLANADRIAAILSDLETRIAPLEGRAQSLADLVDQIAPNLAEAHRLATVVSSVETRIATLEEDRIPLGRAEVDRMAGVVSGVEARIATLLEREHLVTLTAERIAAGLTDAGRLAELVSGVETRIATLEEREQELARAADQIPPGLAEADRLAGVVSGLENRIATLLEREHSLTQAANRLGPGLADAGRLAELVSAMETRVATLLERQRSLAQTADRMAPGLAEADRLTALVSRVKTGLAALRARAEAIVGPARPHRAGDSSRRGAPKRTRGRPAAVAGVAGILALVAMGSGLVVRRARPPVEAAVTPHNSKVPVVTAASSPVLPSPAGDELIPTAPTPVATASPTTPGVIPAATRSASRETRASTAATQERARRPQPAEEPSAPPVYTGALAVHSNPAGGTVFLDRRRVGETPLRLKGVTAGTHVIWIESPGHARWTTAVQVNANKVMTVTATLQPRR